MRWMGYAVKAIPFHEVFDFKGTNLTLAVGVCSLSAFMLLLLLVCTLLHLRLNTEGVSHGNNRRYPSTKGVHHLCTRKEVKYKKGQLLRIMR